MASPSTPGCVFCGQPMRSDPSRGGKLICPSCEPAAPARSEAPRAMSGAPSAPQPTTNPTLAALWSAAPPRPAPAAPPFEPRPVPTRPAPATTLPAPKADALAPTPRALPPASSPFNTDEKAALDEPDEVPTPAGLADRLLIVFAVLGGVLLLAVSAFFIMRFTGDRPTQVADGGGKKGGDGTPRRDDRTSTDGHTDGGTVIVPPELMGPPEPPPLAGPELPPSYVRLAAKVKPTIDKGVVYLKNQLATLLARPGAAVNGSFGYIAIASLTLLECGVPANDPLILKAADEIRGAIGKYTATYDLACGIWFLDRLGEKKDVERIRILAVQLIAAQTDEGGWGYACPVVGEARQKDIFRQLEAGKDGSVSDEKGVPISLLFRPGAKMDFRGSQYSDNSITQFVVLALWASRRHGVLVERPLAMVDARFRGGQNTDGSWGYTLRSSGQRDSMTCAGLMALAVARGTRKVEEGTSKVVRDEVIEKGVRFLKGTLGRAPVNNRIGANSWGDLYYLWSLERLSMVYDWEIINGIDWYAWGAPFLVAKQQADGGWADYYAGIPDTCFALLFLKRANVVRTLTVELKVRGPIIIDEKTR